MRLNLPIPGWRLLRRRLLSGVTLAAYLVAAIGFPVPEAPAQSAHACGQQVCGCGTIEQCKSGGCCCAHETTQPLPEESGPVDCCVKKKVAVKAPTQVKPRSSHVRWVAGMSARQCKAGASEWISAEAGLPTAAPLTWQPSWPYCHSLPITHHFSFAIAADLLDPPPRLETV